jgi:Uma2 family endonuclease
MAQSLNPLHSFPMNSFPSQNRRRTSVDDYHRMAEAGIFGSEERVELLDGEIYEMPPIGIAHAGMVTRLSEMIYDAVDHRAILTIQQPIRLSNDSESQPDLCVLRLRDDRYCRAPATPEDVLLLIEVSDSSLRFDRTVKNPLYCAASVSEIWIVNVADRCIESYPSQQRFVRGDIATASAFPQLTVDVSDLFEPLG